mmetsp:Transcript_15094/g.57332  ORF Transcript_15094/g.57332 Transcript_15094/m.57332 type:complete len:283 (-) Transcript_15094:640-1488(-)
MLRHSSPYNSSCSSAIGVSAFSSSSSSSSTSSSTSISTLCGVFNLLGNSPCAGRHLVEFLGGPPAFRVPKQPERLEVVHNFSGHQVHQRNSKAGDRHDDEEGDEHFDAFLNVQVEANEQNEREPNWDALLQQKLLDGLGPNEDQRKSDKQDAGSPLQHNVTPPKGLSGVEKMGVLFQVVRDDAILSRALILLVFPVLLAADGNGKRLTVALLGGQLLDERLLLLFVILHAEAGVHTLVGVHDEAVADDLRLALNRAASGGPGDSIRRSEGAGSKVGPRAPKV